MVVFWGIYFLDSAASFPYIKSKQYCFVFKLDLSRRGFSVKVARVFAVIEKILKDGMALLLDKFDYLHDDDFKMKFV